MRVLVIGEGFGARVMAPVYRLLGCEVQVASSRDPLAVQGAGAADLVSIHAPPFLHQALVMQALAQGRPVLCDKPFGRNAAEARAMRDAAHAAGVPNFLNFEFRRQPSRAKLKQLLDEGAIGALQHVSWTFIGSGLRRQAYRWLFDAQQGGGWIGAYGSHAIDTLRWLFGCGVADCGGTSRIETPLRQDRQGVDHTATAEDAFTAWFMMDNGATVSFYTAFSAPVTLPNRMILMGSEGSMELLNEVGITLRRPGQEDAVFEFPPPPGDLHEPALIPWITEVLAAVRDGHALTPDFDDGVGVAEAMDLLRARLVRAGRR